MRVAFLVPWFPRASHPFVTDQIIHIANSGHDVHVFAANKPPAADAATVPDDILTQRTTYTRISPGKLRRVGHGLYLFGTKGVRYPVPTAQVLNPLRYGRDALSLRPLFHLAPMLGEEFDIVHCHFGEKARIGAILKQAGIGGKLVTSFHGHGVRRAEEESSRYNRLFQVGDLFLANSQNTYERLAALGVDEERLVHHPVGIDVESFPFRWNEPLTAVPDPLQLLTVARLEPVKGVEYAIRAVALLTERLDAALEYHIVGDGSQRDQLEALAVELGVPDSVVFHGHEHRDAVRQHLAESHLFVLPSVAEAFGLALLEAQAVGLPIVASDVGGVSEAVRGGETARLVPMEEPAAIAAAVEAFAEEPERWIDIGRQARQFVTEHYEADALNAELCRLYAELE